MATVRKRWVERNGKAHSYRAVDYSVLEKGKCQRGLKQFKTRPEAELFRAEIDRQIALASYTNLPV